MARDPHLAESALHLVDSSFSPVLKYGTARPAQTNNGGENNERPRASVKVTKISCVSIHFLCGHAASSCVACPSWR
ncbi:hypothetical protein PF008_g18242 [Phytophthora fragariae]|uniref:Uncharacterized protein n=1 Tax=Phytophthora fragariae TaxID=53985 RepID=A0A6G0R6N9_9STRA|nr:hypothetical protein PF008_g18242 [Phytophthora fragariae]